MEPHDEVTPMAVLFFAVVLAAYTAWAWSAWRPRESRPYVYGLPVIAAAAFWLVFRRQPICFNGTIFTWLLGVGGLRQGFQWRGLRDTH